jgi:type II secretory pathway pseudopilin PulG
VSVSANTRGFVLITVLVTLLLVAAIALLLTSESGGEAARAGRGREALQAQYLVQAALEHALWDADRSSCTAYGLPTTSFGAHTYTATFSPTSGSPATVTATGTLASGATRTLSRALATVHQASSTLTLQLGTTAGGDAGIEASAPTSNNGGATNVRVSANPSARINALLRFDLSSVPYGAHIVSARLELRMWSLASPGPVAVRRSSRAWVEGTRNGGGTADGATWATYDGTAAWTAPGGDFDGDVVSRTTVNSGDTWVGFDLAPLVQQWVDGAPNYGAALVGEGALRTAEFASRETNGAADRPKLTITYACECGIACTPAQGSGKVLMVVSNGGEPSAAEAIKKAVFESWGYTVDVLDQSSLLS